VPTSRGLVRACRCRQADRGTGTLNQRLPNTQWGSLQLGGPNDQHFLLFQSSPLVGACPRDTWRGQFPRTRTGAPVFASVIPQMIVPYADAGALMLANLDRGSAMSRHHIGLALPVGMREHKSTWSAKVPPTKMNPDQRYDRDRGPSSQKA
jgi:hypothetical protein